MPPKKRTTQLYAEFSALEAMHRPNAEDVAEKREGLAEGEPQFTHPAFENAVDVERGLDN